MTLDKIVNDYENYGLTSSNFKFFRQSKLENSKTKLKTWDEIKNRTFHNLEDMFYGINNAEVPTEILEQMNTPEIMAMYVGIGIYKIKPLLLDLKEKSIFKIEDDNMKRITDIEPKIKNMKYLIKNHKDISAEKLISNFVEIGYQTIRQRGTGTKDYNIKEFNKIGFTEYKTNSGDLLDRIKKVPIGSKSYFVEQIKKSKIYSTKESNRIDYEKSKAFQNPNKNALTGWHGNKKKYIDAIVDNLPLKNIKGTSDIKADLTHFKLFDNFIAYRSDKTDYKITLENDGYHCTCKGFIYHKPPHHCKHTDGIKKLKEIDRFSLIRTN